MIDHVKLFVSDLERTVALYERALEPLGYTVMMDLGELGVAFGRDRPELWLSGRGERPPTVAHVALRAENRAAVDAFHRAALNAGATDNGAPGPRPYHPSYYGAFVLDPDGNNLEAVCHS
ncbi:MAG TPA: VOC family protein [Solirubrobacteraceae bacterium]|jgi:catechol 2,3-dioxygenase-like lactoylglutathione lyase family enzyme|nr:VOC family protein [Solirubrobacteraceae bacterium]